LAFSAIRLGFSVYALDETLRFHAGHPSQKVEGVRLFDEEGGDERRGKSGESDFGARSP
jgi:hypothetical protein